MKNYLGQSEKVSLNDKFLLFLILLLFTNYSTAEIVGENYYAHNFTKTFNKILEWEDAYFKPAESNDILLPTYETLEGFVKIKCKKAADGVLLKNKVDYAALQIRICNKAPIIKHLELMAENQGKTSTENPGLQELSSILKVEKVSVDGGDNKVEHFKFPMVLLGHGIVAFEFLLSISRNEESAVITGIRFERSSDSCDQSRLCNESEKSIYGLNEVILNNEKRYLNPSINEGPADFAYTIKGKDYDYVSKITKGLDLTGIISDIQKRYPDIFIPPYAESVKVGDPIFREQENGTSRLYLFMYVELNEDKYNTSQLEDVKDILRTKIDKILVRSFNEE